MREIEFKDFRQGFFYFELIGEVKPDDTVIMTCEEIKEIYNKVRCLYE